MNTLVNNNAKNSISIIEMSEIDKLPEILENLSPSQIITDRHRPYDGQPWTNEGTRGLVEVKCVTMRDITDCLRIALFESCRNIRYLASLICLKAMS